MTSRSHPAETIPKPNDTVLQSVADNARLVLRTVEDRQGETLPVASGSLETLDHGLDDGWLVPGPDSVDDVVAAVGCFVGQVVCEDLDGVWTLDPEEGLHVRIDDVAVNPFAWVDRRIRLREPPLVERWHELTRRVEG